MVSLTSSCCNPSAAPVLSPAVFEKRVRTCCGFGRSTHCVSLSFPTFVSLAHRLFGTVHSQTRTPAKLNVLQIYNPSDVDSHALQLASRRSMNLSRANRLSHEMVTRRKHPPTPSLSWHLVFLKFSMLSVRRGVTWRNSRHKYTHGNDRFSILQSNPNAVQGLVGRGRGMMSVGIYQAHIYASNSCQGWIRRRQSFRNKSTSTRSSFCNLYLLPAAHLIKPDSPRFL